MSQKALGEDNKTCSMSLLVKAVVMCINEIKTPLTSKKLCMFILRVAAQGSCDHTNLTPNYGLIWKVYKPKELTDYWHL